MTDLAIFLATSGHSGVDRIMHNLVPEFAARGLTVDLLQVKDHGPHWSDLPAGVRRVDLGAAHVMTALPALVGYLRRERPTVLLSDKYRVNRAALIARRLAGVDTRVFVRLGTTVSKDLERRRWSSRWSEKLWIRVLYRGAAGMLTPSQGAADDLARLAGVPSSLVKVVRSPVITERIEASAQTEVDHPWLQPGEPPVILAAGELCGRKDFATLMRAFALVVKQRDCRLLIAGEGRHRERLTQLAVKLGIEDRVQLPGFRQDVYALMRKASVFALTSHCEGMPVVLVEALALGVPVLATDCPSGPREILEDGRIGPLPPVGDVEAVARGLLELLERPPSAAFLRQAAAPYTVSNSASEYLNALGLRG